MGKNGKNILILNRVEMRISGTEKDFSLSIWTRLGIYFIYITFIPSQYILLIHINATIFGTGVKIYSVSKVKC